MSSTDYPLPDTPAGVTDEAWAQVVADVRGYCGWHIAPEVEDTLTLDGPGGTILTLPTLRLVDVTLISNDDAEVVDPEWSETGMVRAYCWTRKFRGVVAEITHGFEPWPPDLLGVMTEMATSNSAALAGVKSVSSGTHSFTLDSGTSLTSAQSEVLGRYQLPFVQ